MLLRGVQFPADIDCLAHQIGRPPQAERDHSGGHGAIGVAIDEDEASGFVDLAVGVEGDRAVESDVAEADIVERKGLRRYMLEGVDMDAVAQVGDSRGRRSRAGLEEVLAFRQKFVLVHPDDMGRELVGGLRRGVRAGKDVSAGDIEIIGEHECDRLAGRRLGEVAVGGDDALDGRCPCGRRNRDPHSRTHRSGDDEAAIAPEVPVRGAHCLDRHSEAAT